MTDAEPKYRDEAWLREQYVEQGRPAIDIADELGCCDKTVGDWLRRHNIETPGNSSTAIDPQIKDRGWLREQYVEQGRSTIDIADQFGCSSNSVWRWLRKYNIETRDRTPGTPDDRLTDADWLREQYVEQGRSTTDIADKLGCGNSTVIRYFQKHNIETRSPGRKTPSALTDPSWLCEQYVEQGRSVADIADGLGCGNSTVRRWLHRHNIQTRNNPSGKDHPHWNGGSYPYGEGWTESKKRTVRERDDFACVRCGRSQDSHREEYGKRLHVHHLIKARETDDPAERNAVENLVTLCLDCHQEYERLADAGLRPQISGVTADD